MQALETLLDRANRAADSDGEDRAWLLLLLRQDQPEPATPQPEPATGLAAATSEQQDQELERDQDQEIGRELDQRLALDQEQKPGLEGGPEPVREPDAGSTLQFEPMSTRLPQPDDRPMPFQSREASVVSTILPPAESPPSRPSASSALDQAFAPLEIAFPPLPSLDRKESVAAHPMPAVPTVQWAREEHPTSSDKVEDEGGESEADFAIPNTATTGIPTAAPEPELKLEPPSLIDNYTSHAVAAPVPKFQVEGSGAGEPPPRHNKPQPESSLEVDKSAASPSLAAWRAWLPGAFRTRQRS